MTDLEENRKQEKKAALIKQNELDALLQAQKGIQLLQSCPHIGVSNIHSYSTSSREREIDGSYEI